MTTVVLLRNVAPAGSKHCYAQEKYSTAVQSVLEPVLVPEYRFSLRAMGEDQEDNGSY